MTQTLTLQLERFKQHLEKSEKSPATISKYLHDVNHFLDFIMDSDISTVQVLSYKKSLSDAFKPASANSMLVALNSFLKFIGRGDLCIKLFRLQRNLYYPEERELSKVEYQALVRAAMNSGNERLYLLLQAICSTGIRVSELKYITVESLVSGLTTINCKGKIRNILIPKSLKKPLLRYARKHNISHGAIFITKNGNPLDRTNIWREMKALCALAGVSPSKVFPHNLRHLFARSFYALDKDLAALSDILGHSSINTTRIYTICSCAEHRRKLNRLHLLL